MTRDHVKLALAVCAIIAFWAAVLYLSASHSEDVAEFRKKEKGCSSRSVIGDTGTEGASGTGEIGHGYYGSTADGEKTLVQVT